MVGFERKQVTTKRECQVIQIPSGEPMTLQGGTPVTITQSLGGNYTLITDQGFMVRVAGKDADVLGEVPPAAITVEPSQLTRQSLENLVWQQLQGCYDPEIPVSIVELGLIYRLQIEDKGPGEFRVEVDMTLTAPGCGMGQVLRDDVESRVKSIPGVKEVFVQVVLDPPWDRSMMTEAAKLQLGIF